MKQVLFLIALWAAALCCIQYANSFPSGDNMEEVAEEQEMMPLHRSKRSPLFFGVIENIGRNIARAQRRAAQRRAQRRVEEARDAWRQEQEDRARNYRHQQEVNYLAGRGKVVQHKGTVYNKHRIPRKCFRWDLGNLFDSRCYADCPYCKVERCTEEEETFSNTTIRTCRTEYGSRPFIGKR